MVHLNGTEKFMVQTHVCAIILIFNFPKVISFHRILCKQLTCCSILMVKLENSWAM